MTRPWSDVEVRQPGSGSVALVPAVPTVPGFRTGASLLDQVADFLGDYVAYPSPASRDAVALWVGHSHAVDCFESTPRLAVISPEKGSGKTRNLEMLALLCPAPEHAFNMSAPVLFRLIASHPVTLLVDEADTYFGPKAKDEEGLRGLLNAGHRRGATALRCVGPGHEVGRFPVFCAVALAGIGDLPDTIIDRSVVIPMKRRAPHEQVKAYRARTTEPLGHALRDAVAEWALLHHDELADAEPEMPKGITDRPADVQGAPARCRGRCRR
jgi:hypothetical protein